MSLLKSKNSPPLVARRLWGFSMWPAVKTGQRVLIATSRPFEALKIGDIVCVDYGNRKPVVHRIIEKFSSSRYKTKGDNNRFPDRGFLTRSNYRGQVTFVGGKKIA